MATDKRKFLITLNENILKRVDDFRFENRFNSRSEAIRSLLEEALKKYQKKTQK